MGKRGPNKKGPKQPNSASCSRSMSLREEVTGKKQQHVDSRSMLKIDHLKNLASWASTEACIPPLAAFFGERLAASAEAVGVPPDPSLFSCQRCESLLRPGFNCTVRIEKNRFKVRRRKKSSIPSQNNVSYRCHFCENRNLIRGTPKGHMKVICPQKVKPPLKSKLAKSADQKSRVQESINTSNYVSPQTEKISVLDVDRVENKAKSLVPDAKSGDSQMDAIVVPDANRKDNETNCPATPSVKPVISLLDSMMRKRNRSGAKRSESKNISASVDVGLATNASSKRKRKGWTSLKEIAESTGKSNGKNCGNLTIPFSI